MTKLFHWTLTSQSAKQVRCFELVMKPDHFNWSSSAKGKIAPAVLIMRQNRHYQIHWQILNPEKNVMRSTNLQVKGCKLPLLLGRKNFGIAVQCGRGQGNVQQMQTLWGQWTEAADTERAAGTSFLSVPSLVQTTRN